MPETPESLKPPIIHFSAVEQQAETAEDQPDTMEAAESGGLAAEKEAEAE